MVVSTFRRHHFATSDRRHDDGSFRLDMQYFDYCAGLTMTNAAFTDCLTSHHAKSEQALTQVHMDIRILGKP